MSTQNKPIINIYVHEHYVGEAPLDGLDYVAMRHTYGHPDCHIKLWRGGMTSISGKQDAIRHCVLIALTAAGISLSALRDHKAAKKRVRTELAPGQQSLL